MNPPRTQAVEPWLGHLGMKCIKCGNVVEPEAPRTVETELKGEQISVEFDAPQCMNCGDVVILGRHVRAYHRAVSDAYRRKVGLLTMDEIESLRHNLSMSLPEFASHVGVGIATLKRWRRGEIQTEALDRLVRLRADLLYVEATASELRARLAHSAMTRRTRPRSLSWDVFGHAAPHKTRSPAVVGSGPWNDSFITEPHALAA